MQIVLRLVWVILLAGTARAQVPEPGADVLAEYYPSYGGLRVGKIEIVGLKRSRENIVRWMLGAHEGEFFDARAWQSGIEHLYKTESLYEIHSEIERVEVNGKPELRIVLHVQDKWTLFPYVDFQGGGGAVSLSAGVFDSNLLGTFMNFYVGGSYLAREYSYELGFSQKWFLQTTYSVAFELSKKDVPVTLQSVGGDTLQSFTWKRARQALSIGKQNGEEVYWDVGFETYRDSLRDPSPRTSSFLYRDRGQYRISPALKLWKVSHSDYLEQGHELRVGITSANPTNVGIDYHSASVSWKQVFFLPDTRNVAYYVSFGHVTAAPLAYQYRLGGFDSIRGFSMNRVFGLDVARANLEYRSTILTWRIPYFDLDRLVLQWCAFTDAGSSWNSAGIDLATGQNTQKDTRVLYSAGMGVRGIFLHFAAAIARIDVAKAIYPREGYNVAFGIGQFF
jgi:outer membrane protein assembly factor BamA